MQQLAEFEHLKTLVFASMWATGGVVLAYLASLAYLLRQILATRGLIRPYAPILRWQVVFGPGDVWETRVNPSHIVNLRELRRAGRVGLLLQIFFLLLIFGIGAIRHHWLARVAEIGDEAAASHQSRP